MQVNKSRFNYIILSATILALTPFTKELGWFHFGGISLDLINQPFYIISFLVFFLYNKLFISKSELIIFIILFLIGSMNIVLFSLPVLPFIKQYLPIFIFYVTTRTILKYNNPLLVFDKYVKFSIYVALFGFFQLFLKQFGIHILSSYAYHGIDSLALEPSHYIIMVLPAFIYFYELKKFTWKFWLLGLSLLLTLKLTFFLAFITYYIIVNYKKFKILLFFVPILVFLSIQLIYLIPEMSWRIDSLMVFLQSGNTESIDNLTVFSFISNLQVAIKSFELTYGLGIGLGGHETLYTRYITSDMLSENWYGTNMKSAHCLLIRILSELGLPGLFILFMLFYKTLHIHNFQYKVIALASLSHFVTKFFKSGSYFDYGTIFFLVIIILMIGMDNQEYRVKKRENL